MSRRRTLVWAMAISLGMTIGTCSSTLCKGPAPAEPQAERITYHRDYGTAEIVSGNFIVNSANTMPAKALDFVADRRDAFRLAQPHHELGLLSDKTDRLGLTHLRFQQFYKGLRIWSCQTIVHFRSDRTIYLVGGQTIPTPSVEVVPSISSAEATGLALAALGGEHLPPDITTSSELLIYPDGRDAYLSWLVAATSPTQGAVRWQVFVDAHSGEIKHKFNDIWFSGPDVGSGVDVLGVNRVFPIYDSLGVYKMINTTHTGAIFTYDDYYGGGPIYTDPDGDKIWDDSEDQKSAVSGHYNAEQVYSYFWNTFGRDSYDDLGTELIINVHDPLFEGNAVWDGAAIRLGDGDGVHYRDFSAGLDIVAHEFSHGVSTTSAGFVNQYQPGALGESYSDVFGVMVDRDDWMVGDDVVLTGLGYIRNLADPTEAGDPAHMDDYQTLDYSVNNGGVHINCGIPNHCFYWACALMSREIAEQIWYRCLTTYLTPNSGFYFWAGMIFQSARDLYGTLYDTEVQQALAFVGLGTVYAMPDIVDLAVPIGSAGACSVWVHNPGSAAADVGVVPPTLAGLTITELPGNHPTIPAGDSAGFVISVGGGTATECDISIAEDTLRFDVSGSVSTQIKLPLAVAVRYAATSLETDTLSTACLDVRVNNRTCVMDIGPPGEDILYTSSLMVGMMDGTLPNVYRSLYGVYRFIPVNHLQVEPGRSFFRLASEDARILGSVEYTWLPGEPDSCEFVIAKYTLKNVCDTALNILTGFLADFDIENADQNFVNYDSSRQMVYQTDSYDTKAGGVALLDGQVRNLRGVTYAIARWGGDVTFYSQMSQTSNAAGTAPADYTTLITFGDGQIGAGDSLTYTVALLHSGSGSGGLGVALDKARKWVLICCKGVRGNANGDPDDKVNISDVSYLLEFLFGIPTGPEPPCWEEGNANGDPDEKVNVSDVSYLLDYLFGIPTGPEPKPCP
ncbi:MAG: M4 family metallopeptidase [candidate division Zixibacteria bacterium]|nr:M4 family metallopeptidase [candidate division Zixibacteria bacterium]